MTIKRQLFRHVFRSTCSVSCLLSVFAARIVAYPQHPYFATAGMRFHSAKSVCYTLALNAKCTWRRSASALLGIHHHSRVRGGGDVRLLARGVARQEDVIDIEDCVLPLEAFESAQVI